MRVLRPPFVLTKQTYKKSEQRKAKTKQTCFAEKAPYITYRRKRPNCLRKRHGFCCVAFAFASAPHIVQVYFARISVFYTRFTQHMQAERRCNSAVQRSHIYNCDYCFAVSKGCIMSPNERGTLSSCLLPEKSFGCKIGVSGGTGRVPSALDSRKILVVWGQLLCFYRKKKVSI